MKSKRKVITLASLIVTLGVVVGSTFAWIVNGDSLHGMGFKILQIDSEVNTYIANDVNLNGVPDLLSSENTNKYYTGLGATTLEPYAKSYYNERYQFSYLDKKYALSKESEVNLISNLEINNVLPTKVYTYKFELINFITIESNISFIFQECENMSNMQYFELRICTVHSIDNEASYSMPTWSSFTVSNGTSSALELIKESDNVVLPGTNDEDHGRIDLWLQIRMKEECENVKMESFDFPTFSIKFKTDMGSEGE